ncbi:MAG: alpha/beta hydrolase [Flavipsychrobacter sp.]|nr:alpha/beta hydrolase [Flavipsychrobacter sp.]
MSFTSQYITTNGIRLHYLDFYGDGPTLVLMHGLTANAHGFDGMIAAGLDKEFRVISVDLRGRGLSDQPESYTIPDHAKDIIGLLDFLGIQEALIGGHSFGGLLTFYLAYHYPDRVKKMILLDAAAKMHPNTREMLTPTLSRLGMTFSSFDEYLQKVKVAPYNTFWEDSMKSYYEADVETLPDGGVIPRSKIAHIGAAAVSVLSEPWSEYISSIEQPAILINATGIYTLDAPLLPKELALETVGMMQNCTYVGVGGNHQTMLYGTGAKQIVSALNDFLAEDRTNKW